MTKGKAASLWTLWTGAVCETESFGSHHLFAAVGSDTGLSNGDKGTYKRSTQRRATRLKMSWTAGAASGAVFQGRYVRSIGDYGGSYTDGGLSVGAHLDRAATFGCPVVTAAPASTSVAYGSGDDDTVTVTGTGGVAPTGLVNFSVCPGDASPCDENSPAALSLGTVDVSGSGDTVRATSPSFDADTLGNYCFAAVYSGAHTYASVVSASTSDQCFTVTPAGSVTTAAPGSASVALGASDTDTATVRGVNGGSVPTGTVTFYVCGPDTTLTSCGAPTPASGSGVEVGSPVTLLPGSGLATATSAAVTPTATGAYCFLAVYSGDHNFAVVGRSNRRRVFRRGDHDGVVNRSGQSREFTRDGQPSQWLGRWRNLRKPSERLACHQRVLHGQGGR